MIKRVCLLAVAFCGVVAWALAGDLARKDSPPDRQTATTYEGLIRPSRRVQLALRASGVIAQRPVAEGDRVKAGQLIAELNSELEKASLDITRMKAEDNLQVQAAEMAEKQALVEQGRLEELFKRNMATTWEYQEVKVKADIAKVRTAYAKFQRELTAQELKRDQAALAERRLVAPCDGVICRTFKEAGEAAEQLTPIAELVQLDTLWVELNVPADRFGRIRLGQAAAVTIPGRSRGATVIMVDPMVDAASATFRVRLELPNADGAFAAGLQAAVRFQPREATATAPEASGKI